MKNLKKIVKSELKKIHGGNAPVCEYDEIACRYPPADGNPAFWTCEPIAHGCGQ
ncbi:bacteriocin-like protein [Chryseobacterium jejuense]|uniref:bacteriocin-like protein n=1 Tax=Chryseobacterium jejuense TaxID=445960 RepID=UPI001AE803C5|nr:hypothetical protein [Chryseobacterium jejuense]MBP2616717.1 hypothetical protein [Chryseobacterium jejuense]